jgi:hypothetical protein
VSAPWWDCHEEAVARRLGLCVARDWNEDYQGVRDMQPKTIPEKLLKAKMLYKVRTTCPRRPFC